MKKYEGFYRVFESGFSYCTGWIYNPETKEERNVTFWDSDNPDRHKEENEIPGAPEIMVREWRHNRNEILPGDYVIINRGRKMKGEIKRVIKEFTYTPEGTYAFYQTQYLAFTDGTKVNKQHCDLYKASPTASTSLVGEVFEAEFTTVKPELENAKNVKIVKETEKAIQVEADNSGVLVWVPRAWCPFLNKGVL